MQITKLYPKLVRRRNIKNKTPTERNNYCNKNLNSAINKKRQELKTLTEEHSSILKHLKDFRIWMKGTLVIYSSKQQLMMAYAKTPIKL